MGLIVMVYGLIFGLVLLVCLSAGAGNVAAALACFTLLIVGGGVLVRLCVDYVLNIGGD